MGKRKEFSLKWKNNLWGGYSESIGILFLFWSSKKGRRVLMKKKNGEITE